jgi:hypothetical protein
MLDVVSAVAELDIRGILEELNRAGVEFLEALALGGNWVLRTRLGRFDVMQWIGEDELWEKLSPTAIEAEIGGLVVRIVGYEELVALKENAGRPEDLIDLQRLRQARGEE